MNKQLDKFLKEKNERYVKNLLGDFTYITKSHDPAASPQITATVDIAKVWSFISASISEAWEINSLRKK